MHARIVLIGSLTVLACASPPDAVTDTCRGPGDCPAGAPLCCGTMQLGEQSGASCPVLGAQTVCAAACQSSAAITCPGVSQGVLCEGSADCAGQVGFEHCCVFRQGLVALNLCVTAYSATTAETCLP